MQVFHRLKRTLSSGIASLLDDVENQEAVVAVTVREVGRSALRVSVERKGAERRVESLSRRALELDSEQRAWRDRACRLRDDRDKALECVRRLRAVAGARKDTLSELEKQRELLAALSADDRAIAQRLDELRRRSARLASRQARSEAELGSPELADVDAVLDRWEARVERSEAAESSPRDHDPFLPALTEREEAALVSAELDRLLADERPSPGAGRHEAEHDRAAPGAGTEDGR